MNYYDRLLRTKDELENLIHNYQASPINNFINTGVQTDLWDMKKLNEGEEAENILISRDTVFLGTEKLQIKKIDGTIEKYDIQKYYPIDEKDEMIKNLERKVEELERRLEDEPTKHSESTTGGDKSTTNDDVNSKS